MAYLGFLALGVFVGTLICVAIGKTTNWTDAVKLVTALIGAALSGVVFTFIQWMHNQSFGPSIFMYPVGLAWSLIWLYAYEALINLKEKGNLQIIGWLHISGMVIATVLVLLLLLSKDFRNLLPQQDGQKENTTAANR